MADDDPVTFGEVVKAFTPPGTDFEAFKASLHSEGAAGAINPGLIAALNHSGIMPPVNGQAGTTCARCDHLHGGPPGPACLEAEAHLGRSPLRRSPDLQLDAISGPRQASPPAGPLPGTASAAAIAAHEMFTDFMMAGFTEDQAIRLVAGVITNGGSDG